MISFDFLNSYFQDQGAIETKVGSGDLLSYSINNQIFAYIGRDSVPLRVSLRVDEVLIKHLSQQYESVMPGHKLNPKKWLTLVATGQLEDQAIIDLANRAIVIAKTTAD